VVQRSGDPVKVLKPVSALTLASKASQVKFNASLNGQRFFTGKIDLKLFNTRDFVSLKIAPGTKQLILYAY
jgi:hypothetical protein